MVVAVLLAGGSGSRMGSERPKQFLEVKGKTILEWTIEAFHRHPLVDEIAIVSRPDCIEEVKRLACPYPKVRKVLPGGKERYDSSLAAIRAYREDGCRLLLHDAVRPLVSERIITECIEALDSYEAVNVAVPCTDTIIEVSDEGIIRRIPPRSSLRNVQTPQGFRRGTILRAYDIALQDPAFQTTDDCGVVFRYLPDVPIRVVEGDMQNIKVTYPRDLLFMEEKVER